MFFLTQTKERIVLHDSQPPSYIYLSKIMIFGYTLRGRS